MFDDTEQLLEARYKEFIEHIVKENLIKPIVIYKNENGEYLIKESHPCRIIEDEQEKEVDY